MSTPLKMFLLAVFAVILLTAVGCIPAVREVRCEQPWYSGPVEYAWMTASGGTFIRTAAGERLEYPPSVKCELVGTGGWDP